MELVLLLITSGIPGFYTYYALSNKNIIYFNSDNKNVILGLFSIISILIFLLILSLFSGINNVQSLFENLLFTKICLALVTTIIITVFLTELIYPIIYLTYYNLMNMNRNNNSLSKTGILPIHINIYENSSNLVYVIVKNFSNEVISQGFLKDYSRKQNRNILLDQDFIDEFDSIKGAAKERFVYIDFENECKLIYYLFDKN